MKRAVLFNIVFFSVLVFEIQKRTNYDYMT